ncbi:Jacalin-related lectin 17 [Cardamine amara subsp. amara]|uniref:Jacalin-related lectin 17 n=1 Tax=Cardamine amara subsp. amara TaxID=228776 RepID=A0ABD1BV05_CARAN
MSQDSKLFEMTQRVEAEGKRDLGTKWDDGPDQDDVTKIYVRGDSDGIKYIRFDYIKFGKPEYKSFHGFTDIGFKQTFEINHENDEQLESVEGYYEPQTCVIVGLQFKTNLRISELIGYVKKGATKFSLAVEGKKIVGFHGSFYAYLNSLGAYFTWTAPSRMEAKGGQGGEVWNDGSEHEDVTKICVRGGSEGIQYIKCDYVKDGKQIDGSVHGGTGRGFTEPFEINHLNKEYLVSVEGYYDEGDSGVIQGIKFKTNIKTSELMGGDQGRKFSLAANGKKIVGFHGYADKYLNSLGAYFTTSASTITKLEPIGNTTAGANAWDDGTFEGIRKVCVHYDANYYVGCVKFDYENGGKVETREHGGVVTQEGEFVVDYPNEFITHVEGTLDNGANTLVTSLTFKTSKGRTSSTFGRVTTTKFVLESKGCGLVGFYGWSASTYLYALGAYFSPPPPPPKAEKVEAKGGDGGTFWDDGGFDNIRKIYIGHSKIGITFIKFMYDKDNEIMVGDDHGSKTLLKVDEFELEYRCEYLISVEGSYDVDGSESEVVCMLRFKTNMRTSQLFGVETTTSRFILQKEHHKIVGFHGKFGNMLHQIGVHVIPIKK